MLAGVAVFSVMDAGLKALSSAYPPMEVAALRATASLPFLLVSLGWSNRWGELVRIANPAVYVLRAAIGVLMIGSFVFSVARQGLTDAYAVFMSAPLLVAILSRLVLGERVPARRLIAIVVGRVGVLIALKPRGGGFVSVAGLAAAVSALCYAANVMSIRLLGRADSNHALVFWNLVGMAILAALLASRDWAPVAIHDLWLVAVIGVTGAIAQHLLTTAFRLASPSTVAPFEYTALVWGMLIDYLAFARAPLPRVVLGALVVAAGGLYLIWDEHRRPARP